VAAALDGQRRRVRDDRYLMSDIASARPPLVIDASVYHGWRGLERARAASAAP
jgi:hypothetical protein